MRHLLVCATAPVLLLCLAGTASAANAYRMAGDTQKALQQLEDAFERLTRARAAMVALDAGEPPKGQAEDWAGVPAALASAAEALRRSGGPQLPDPDEPLVSHRQLRSCATRADALARLERQQRALQGGAQRGVETRAALSERLAAVQAAEETRRSLLRAAARHAEKPALAETFTWRWSDVEGPAATALASAASELRRYQERVERSISEHRSLASEAGALLAAHGRVRDCQFAGSWNGTRTLGGSVSGLSVQLTSSGESWTGTVSLDGASVPAKAVTIDGNAVTISLADGRGTLSGALSPDGRGLKGSFSSRDGLATVQLRRQP